MILIFFRLLKQSFSVSCSQAKERALQYELRLAKSQLEVQNDVLSQLRAYHVTNTDRSSPGPHHPTIAKLRKEKEALAEEFARSRADVDAEMAMLKRENESLKMVLNPVSFDRASFVRRYCRYATWSLA
jgi:hypothetical protein